MQTHWETNDISMSTTQVSTVKSSTIDLQPGQWMGYFSYVLWKRYEPIILSENNNYYVR